MPHEGCLHRELKLGLDNLLMIHNHPPEPASSAILPNVFPMQYPLTLRFKIATVAPQISVTDAEGDSICYVKQKLFKLKERVEVFTDSTQSEKLAEIHADKVIDWSATYTISDPAGNTLGAVQRSGTRSLWRAHYEIKKDGITAYKLREGNPWTKFFDGLFGGIPIIGMFSGYLFHPTYEVRDSRGELCYRVRKRPAFLEGVFTIGDVEPSPDDVLVLLSILMMTLLERQRG